MSLRHESPQGDSPDEDVACADCGSYRSLVGPLSFEGEVVGIGDMVCVPCAESRGFTPEAEGGGSGGD